MRRSALTRITTVLYAVWLVVSLGAQTAQPCPTHDAASLPGSHAAMPGMATPGMAMPGMAHDATNHAAQAPAHESSHDGGAHHACTCVGCCCASSPDLTSARAAQVPPSRIVVAANVAPVMACRVPASRVRRLLPFANGPPAASSVTA